MKNKIIIAITLLIILFLFSSCTVLMMNHKEDGNIAVIPIEGIITTSNSGRSFATSQTIVNNLKKASENNNIKGIILEINSPGGSPVASDEIGEAIKKVRENNKTVVAWIRELGASGGYWVASNADYIVANKMSITGSIGVIGSSFGFEDLLKEWNISYRRLVSGDKKDIGTPFRTMDYKEKKFMQDKLDKIHEFFIQEVANNRNMNIDKVKELATGEFFLGVEAKDNGLIDELGGLDEAKEYISKKENIDKENIDLIWYKKKSSLFDLIGELKSNPYNKIETGNNEKIKLE